MGNSFYHIKSFKLLTNGFVYASSVCPLSWKEKELKAKSKCSWLMLSSFWFMILHTNTRLLFILILINWGMVQEDLAIVQELFPLIIVVVIFVLLQSISRPGFLSTHIAGKHQAFDMFRFNVSLYISWVAFLSTDLTDSGSDILPPSCYHIFTEFHHRVDLII